MKCIFDRFHVWLAAHAPEVLASLRPGASARAIRAAERDMQVTFPEDVKAAYRIHDGQDVGYDVPDFVYGWRWNSLEGMVEDWRLLMEMCKDMKPRPEPKGTTRTDWWHPAWIPVANNGNGDYRMLDLAPGPHGCVGQILFWWSDEPRTGGKQRVIQDINFTHWLAGFASELESGDWAYAEEFGGLALADELDLDDE